ncbi:REP-associated tyrosine transposase [Pseudomonas sp. NPDC088368]|jgi:REP element-mobilizing transposase RayT|uniref:REP-associated tyrosine transposase n=1 Tax=Pseudomonas sp. NPDC088368 TaxID=3364453 RepID=UPI0037FDD174
MSARPQSRRLRLGRCSLIDQVYLITAVTHNRQPFFSDWRAARLLVHQLRKAQWAGLADSLAWVVMPDRFHWLMQLKDRELSAVVHRVKCQAAGQVNGYLGRSGQFWQRGFHDRALRSDEDVRPVARYIIANPIRAGLVKRVHDYPLWDAHWLDGCEY